MSVLCICCLLVVPVVLIPWQQEGKLWVCFLLGSHGCLKPRTSFLQAAHSYSETDLYTLTSKHMQICFCKTCTVLSSSTHGAFSKRKQQELVWHLCSSKQTATSVHQGVYGQCAWIDLSNLYKRPLVKKKHQGGLMMPSASGLPNLASCQLQSLVSSMVQQHPASII